MGEMQYVVKVRMKHTGSYSVGPYRTLEEAEAAAKDIVFGGLNTLRTQRGTTILLCADPEVVEVVSFVRKNEEA